VRGGVQAVQQRGHVHAVLAQLLSNHHSLSGLQTLRNHPHWLLRLQLLDHLHHLPVWLLPRCRCLQNLLQCHIRMCILQLQQCVHFLHGWVLPGQQHVSHVRVCHQRVPAMLSRQHLPGLRLRQVPIQQDLLQLRSQPVQLHLL